VLTGVFVRVRVGVRVEVGGAVFTGVVVRVAVGWLTEVLVRVGVLVAVLGGLYRMRLTPAPARVK
jgi:hypothetical protein